jgi:hypothetical protein
MTFRKNLFSKFDYLEKYTLFTFGLLMQTGLRVS